MTEERRKEICKVAKLYISEKVYFSSLTCQMFRTNINERTKKLAKAIEQFNKTETDAQRYLDYYRREVTVWNATEHLYRKFIGEPE